MVKIAPRLYMLRESNSKQERFAYILQRNYGNYLFYSLDQSEQLKDFFYSIGGVAKQLLNNEKQIYDSCSRLFSLFGASAILDPITPSLIEANPKLRIESFEDLKTYEPRIRYFSLNSPAATKNWYYIVHDEQALLFTGSSLFFFENRWEIHPDQSLAGMKAALHHIRDLKVDLVLSHETLQSDSFVLLNEKQKQKMVKDLLERIELAD